MRAHAAIAVTLACSCASLAGIDDYGNAGATGDASTDAPPDAYADDAPPADSPGDGCVAGHVYLTCGWQDDVPSSNVWVAPIQCDGDVGAFTVVATVPAQLEDHTTAFAGSALLIAGGDSHNAGLKGFLYRFPLDADGGLGARYDDTGQALLKLDRVSGAAVADGLYVIGGRQNPNPEGGQPDDVAWVTRVSYDGPAPQLVPSMTLPTATSWGCAASAGSTLFVVTGPNAGAASAYMAQVDGAGNVTWNTAAETTAPHTCKNASAAFVDATHAVIVTSDNSGGPTYADLVTFTAGRFGFGTMQNVPSPFALVGHRVVAFGGRVYVLGGWDGVSNTSAFIYAADFTAEGAGAQWRTAGKLPGGMRNFGVAAR